ncbi:unannotated protein [freshwater metagenome]|uniref:Unannotated protein n=1 Tax=freshwater metagenome TaxID=449393 RepID=A0A6J7ATD2_9ZZZZ
MNSRGVGEAQLDQPALGLVGNRIATQFGHDREPHLSGSGSGIVGAAHFAFGRQRHPVLAQQRL